MFNRRNNRTRIQQAREVLWPSMGWQRTYHYYKHRVSRLSGTADAVAYGLASGAAASFTPFLGFHILIAMGITWLLRGNLIAAALGTLAGNPWTFPLIWIFTYKLGASLMMGFSQAGVEKIPTDITFSTLWNNPLDLLVPMTIGGVLSGIVVWFVVFYLMRGVVRRYQRRRARRRRRKMIMRKLSKRRKARKAAARKMKAAMREIVK